LNPVKLLFFLTTGLAVCNAATVYNSIPNPLPGNVPRLGYQATQTAEFGNAVNLAGTERALTTATVVMSDWAKESDYQTVGTSAGYNHPLTLTFYDVGAGGTVGSVIASITQSAFIPWRPEVTTFNGIAFTVDFDFTGLGVVLPDQVIYGLAYNTQTWGANPIGAPGPYNSLNFGYATVAPTVGTNVDPDAAYWNTSTAANYTDLGVGGVGTFRQDTLWSPYSGAIAINAEQVPEPGTWMLLSGGIALLAASKRWKLQLAPKSEDNRA
jgi:hypothetical protein